MEVKAFRLSDFLGEKDVFHLARVHIQSRQDVSLHTHDYNEIFWVEGGNGFHLINGHKIKLEVGDLIMIRKEDVHTFTANRKGFTMMNLAFKEETVAFLRERYFGNSETYFWGTDTLPFSTKIDANIIQRISQRAEESLKDKTKMLHLDSLLLFIFRMIGDEKNVVTKHEIPSWLIHAKNAFNQPEKFRSGAHGFAALCNKNRDYVNRVIRKHHDMTLSELVNQLRMTFASQQLIITSAPIKKIAYDSGYFNIGHFHAVFKEHFRVTPGEYRKLYQTIY